MRGLGKRVGVAVTVAVLATTAFSAAEPGPATTQSVGRVDQLLNEARFGAVRTDPVVLGRPARLDAPSPAGDTAIAPPPAHFDGPPAPSAPLPDELRQFLDGERRPGGGVWAVVIGIDDYPGGRSDLRSAVNDADDVDDVDRALARFGVPSDRRVVLRDRYASAEALGIAADWLVANANADATAVFFYAGHAHRRSATRHAIVGADGTPVTDLDLRDRLQGLRAAQTWIGIAACAGGGFDELTLGVVRCDD